jgi:hypothetical protein
VARERSWTVRVAGFPEVSTNDLTLDEAALAERVSGVPYTIMNPHANVKVAKALLAVLLTRARMLEGKPREIAENEAIETAGTMPLSTLHGAFLFDPGEGPPPGEGAHDPPG